MKRTIFYATNSVICTIFLSVRLAFSLSVIGTGHLTERSELLLNTFTLLLILFLVFNIYQGYREIRRENIE